jgi:hypothetical protein
VFNKIDLADEKRVAEIQKLFNDIKNCNEWTNMNEIFNKQFICYYFCFIAIVENIIYL